MSFGSNSSAGEYELIMGKGVEVCEACKKNFDTFFAPKDSYRNSMKCGREFDPTFRDLQGVRWTKVELKANLDLLKKVVNVIDHRDQFQPPFDVGLFRDLEQGKKVPSIELYESQVDIDNDGVIDTLVRYVEDVCDMGGVYEQPIVVLNAEKTAVDMERTQLILQKYLTSDWAYQVFGVFLYKGQTYFDQWNGRADNLFIYRISKKTTEKLCEFRFRIKKAPKSK